MKRVIKILKHPVYTACLKQIKELEKDRIFCGHDLAHFLDVARVAALLNAEEGLDVSKELIYAAALLHDIGRHEQYLNGTAHNEASAAIATGILEDCGFTEEEKTAVLGAITEHRMAKEKRTALADIIYRADKLSRPCFNCRAEAECNWSRDKKNMTLRY